MFMVHQKFDYGSKSVLIPRADFSSSLFHYEDSKQKSAGTTPSPLSTATSSASPSIDEKKVVPISQTDIRSVAISRWDRFVKWNKDLPGRIKKELLHYWMGTKLLVYEVRTCINLLNEVTKGHSLTRRERKQLLRTASDLLRLVPFAIILIVPFMEFSLPFLLKYFPNMLPSTFQDHVKQESDIKRQLSAKIEVAKFLQEALAKRATALQQQQEELIEEFSDFEQKMRSGYNLETKDVLKFAKLFEDDLTLDNLPREHLVLMCKFLQLNTFGTDAFLRFQLSQKLKFIKKDDKLIQQEGVESMTLAELQQACIARGIRFGNSKSKAFLQERLSEWLELSLDYNLPGSMLIYSNAVKMTANMKPRDVLREALYTVNSQVLDEIRLKVSEMSGRDDVASSLRLEILKKENAEIAQEKKDQEITETAIKKIQDNMWIEEHQDLAQSSINFTAKQLREIASAVNILLQNSSLAPERQELEKLKEALEKRKSELTEAESQQGASYKREEAEAKEESQRDAAELAKQVEQTPEASEAAQIKRRAREMLLEDEEEEQERKRGEKRFRKETERILQGEDKLGEYVEKLVNQMDRVEPLVSEKLRVLDLDRDGVISLEELSNAMKLLKGVQPREEQVRQVMEKLDVDKDGMISLKELEMLTKDLDILHDDEDEVETDAETEGKEKGTSSDASSATKDKELRV